MYLSDTYEISLDLRSINEGCMRFLRIRFNHKDLLKIPDNMTSMLGNV